MSFKDVIANDIKNAFINKLEFADEHTFGGVVISCVIDEQRYKDKQTLNKTLDVEGVYKDTLTLFCSTLDVSYRVKKGQTIELDGVEFEVLECAEDMGIYEIDLGRYDESGRL